MCLIVLALDRHPDYRLIFAANRDEFHDRPTAPADFWDEYPHLLAGKDLKAGGSWMGITKSGRFAAITNFRDLTSIKDQAPSRGEIVTAFLLGDETPEAFLRALRIKGRQYNGFNLIVGDADSFWYYSNVNDLPTCLAPGIYGLSNHLIDTTWPKIRRAKTSFEGILREESASLVENLFTLLSNRTVAPDDQLPDTGVGTDWERLLSPIFITSPTYGTRSSTVVTIDRWGEARFIERTWTIDGELEKEAAFTFILSAQS